jgi:UDP-N-acetylmuramoyl-tripeptide--D-alanyl-D-alanine ligase
MRLAAFLHDRRGVQEHMEQIQLQELISAVRGEFLSGDPHSLVRAIVTDGRTLRAGEYFLALAGRNFDGHDFLQQVIEKGAGGIIISRQEFDLGNAFPRFPAVVRVKDTLRALGDIAAFYRRRFSIPVVGVTGSNGKTTTREMLAAILRATGPTLSNGGNYNNLIGVPQTLLQLGPTHRYAVIEMGTSIPGEIGRLAEIAAPDLGIITNIGVSHLENFKSRDGVFDEKSALFRALPPNGCAVINNDDPYLRTAATSLGRECTTFGIENDAQVMARNITLWPSYPSFDLCFGAERLNVTLPVYGRFNVANALAAAAAAWKLGVKPAVIADALRQFVPPKMRMEVHTLVSGTTIINDAYNANPVSMKESVASLVQTFPDREKIVILGDMLELGPTAADAHRAMGEFLASQPLSRIFLYGPLMRNAQTALQNGAARHFVDKDDLASALKGCLSPGAVVLFKASRGMAIEKIADNIVSGQ